jgi:hypothetical protein
MGLRVEVAGADQGAYGNCVQAGIKLPGKTTGALDLIFIEFYRQLMTFIRRCPGQRGDGLGAGV